MQDLNVFLQTTGGYASPSEDRTVLKVTMCERICLAVHSGTLFRSYATVITAVLVNWVDGDIPKSRLPCKIDNNRGVLAVSNDDGRGARWSAECLRSMTAQVYRVGVIGHVVGSARGFMLGFKTCSAGCIP